MDFLPFAKLSQKNISPRVRSVLESAYQLVWKEIDSGLKRSFEDFDRELFKQAERSGTNDKQNRIFEAQKIFRQAQSLLTIAARDDFQRSMLALLDPERSMLDKEPQSMKLGSLSLVDENKLEVELALTELAARWEMKCSAILTVTAIRFAVVSGGAPVMLEQIPVGPHRILTVLSKALESIDAKAAYKVDFLRTFDRQLLVRLPDILDALNAQFVEQRVLANLNIATPKKAAETESKKVDENKPEEKKIDEKATEEKPALENAANPSGAPSKQTFPGTQAQPNQIPLPKTPAADPFGFFSTPSPTAAPVGNQPAVPAPPAKSAPAPAVFDLGPLPPLTPSAPSAMPGIAGASGAKTAGMKGGSSLTNSTKSAPANVQAAQSAITPKPPSANAQNAESSAQTTPELDQELFSTLRELLGGRRASMEAAGGSASMPAPSGPVASTQDVQSVLSVLQTLHSAPVMVGNKWKSRRVSDVKTDLMTQLRQLYDGQNPRLDQEVSDTVDLVGMLFDHVLQDSSPSSTVHSLLTKLQVPVLKVAIQDKSFFSRRNHPARQLLNAIGDNSMFWGDGDDVDEAVVERMQLVVDRIISEYDNDIGVFSNLLTDLSGHVNTLQRKAEVSEKRNVDAAKGREKLEIARVSASKSIDQFVKGHMLPPLVVHLLEGAWADVLALTQLRMDTSSPIYQERLEVAEQLAGCFDIDNPVTREDFEELRPVLEEGMSLVGFHGPEIERTLKAVSDLVVEGEALIPALEPTEEREVTNIVRNKARLGQDQDAEKTESPQPKEKEKQSILAHLKNREEKIPLTAKEQQTVERLKQLPFGTWFEFVVNQQGEKAKRKLSWYSTVTGRCLFVNSRGAKVAEKTLDELARDLVRGNAHVWEPSQEGMIDRAWRSIKDKLKNWTLGGRSVGELAAEGN